MLRPLMTISCGWSFQSGIAVFMSLKNAIKVSPPFEKIRPFVGAGLGVSYVYLRGGGTSDAYGSDLMEEVPLGS